MRNIIKSAAVAGFLGLALGPANLAHAQDAEFTLPAGVACPTFDLTIEITFAKNRVMKEFTDRFGNPVRIFEGGKGSDLTFINESTGAEYFIKGNGSVAHTTLNLDGSMEVSTGGHNVLIFFPTDLPSGVGPSTRQYIGRVEYSVSPDGIFTLQRVRGRTVDICAILSDSA